MFVNVLAFGPERFLVPAMLLITVVLTAARKRIIPEKEDAE